MSTLMIGAAAVAFVLPLLIARRRRPRAGKADAAAPAAWLQRRDGQPWQLPVLRGEEIVAATDTAAQMQTVLAALPADAWMQRSCTSTLLALADYVQLLPGSHDTAYGGLWRECLDSAARALAWPACGKPVCPRQPLAAASQGGMPALAALLAGAFAPLRSGLLRADVLLHGADSAHQWVPLLGPMRRNVWGAVRYAVQPRSDAAAAERIDLYRRTPAIALDFVLDPLAGERLRRDAALHAELTAFLRAEPSTRFERMLADPDTHCTCFETPQHEAAAPAPPVVVPIQPAALAP